MKKRDLVMERMQRTNPVSSDSFEELATSKESELTVSAITRESLKDESSRLSTTRPLRRTGRRVIAVGAVCATAFAIVAVNGTEPHPGGSGTAWAAELVRFAEVSPRLLLDAEGWTVTRADELSDEIGEMTFSNGTDDADLHWRPLEQHRHYVEDRRHGAEASWPITIAETTGVLFQYEGTSSFTALWSDDGRSLEFRADSLGTKEAFENVAATLRSVDVDTWLSAMPESVVKPDARSVAVDEMLDDIPVPDSLDVGKLKQGDVVSDEYQLGAQVTGTVACTWINEWIHANSRGDSAARERAVAALESSHDWEVLSTMKGQGSWSEVLWSYADAIVTDPGAGADVVAGYDSGLGCSSKL